MPQFSNCLNFLSRTCLGTRQRSGRTHARSHTNHKPPTHSAVWFEVVPSGSQLPTECVTGLSTGLFGSWSHLPSRRAFIFFSLCAFVALCSQGAFNFSSLTWLAQPHRLRRVHVCVCVCVYVHVWCMDRWDSEDQIQTVKNGVKYVWLSSVCLDPAQCNCVCACPLQLTASPLSDLTSNTVLYSSCPCGWSWMSVKHITKVYIYFFLSYNLPHFAS